MTPPQWWQIQMQIPHLANNTNTTDSRKSRKKNPCAIPCHFLLLLGISLGNFTKNYLVKLDKVQQYWSKHSNFENHVNFGWNDLFTRRHGARRAAGGLIGLIECLHYSCTNIATLFRSIRHIYKYTTTNTPIQRHKYTFKILVPTLPRFLGLATLIQSYILFIGQQNLLDCVL